MKESDLKLLRDIFQELNEKTENALHQRILTAAITSDEDFLESMEKELGDYLLEVLNHED